MKIQKNLFFYIHIKNKDKIINLTKYISFDNKEIFELNKSFFEIGFEPSK